MGVGIVGLIVLIFIALLTYIIVMSRRDYKKGQEEQKLKQLPTPHFFGMNPGDEFSVDYQGWKIKEIESDFDIDFNQRILRITAYSIGETDE